MRTFIIKMKMGRTEFLQYGAILLAGYLLGLVLCFFLLRGEGEYVTLGTLMAATFAAFIHFFGSVFSFLGEFNMGISMGATRKELVRSYALFLFVQILLLEIVLVLSGMAEKAMLAKMMPGGELRFDLTAYMKPGYLLAIAAVMMVAEIFCGAVLLRFGMKAFWVLWAVWMISAVLLPRLLDNGRLSVLWNRLGLALGGHLTAAGIWTAVLAVTAILAGISWGILRKQKVVV